jgi:hypothetical protein
MCLLALRIWIVFSLHTTAIRVCIRGAIERAPVCVCVAAFSNGTTQQMFLHVLSRVRRNACTLLSPASRQSQGEVAALAGW